MQNALTWKLHGRSAHAYLSAGCLNCLSTQRQLISMIMNKLLLDLANSLYTSV